MSTTPVVLPHIWVASDAHLAELCQGWQQAEALAMDTEFIRTDTFYPRPALLQVSDGKAAYLLDVLALHQLQPLQELLGSGPLKVFHSCSEDLEMLKHWLGVLPQPLVDTQLAAGFVLKDAGIGYQRLVEELLNIPLEKGETRSDWLQRPLTAAQQNYAAQDVEFLLPVWQVLQSRLQAEGWLEAALQESRWLVQEAEATATNQAWLRLKQAWQLSPRQLAALQALAAWRETTAQALDRPRNRIASDALLQALAIQDPSNLKALAEVQEASPGWIKRYGDPVLAQLESVRALPESQLPEVRVSPLSQEYKQLRKSLRQALKTLAGPSPLPMELLARRKQQELWLEALLKGRQPQLPEGYPAWKREPLKTQLARLKVEPHQ